PFSVSGTPVTITAPGVTTGNTSTLTLTPASSFTGLVNLTCTTKSFPANASSPPTCAIPSSVSITSTAPVTATMTISTTAPHTSTAPRPPLFSPKLPWQPLLVASTLLCLLVLYPRKRRRLIFATMLLLFSVGVFAGCGGGSSTPPVVQIPGTTPGTY